MRRWTALSILLAALLITSRTAFVASGPFQHDGFAGKHSLDSAAPNESVDPLSGNLLIAATDLALPGPAGMDLAVTRFYSSQIYPNYEASGSTTLEEDNWAGVGWRLHWGRILNRQTMTACNGGDTPPSAVVDLPGGFGGSLHIRPGYLSPSFTEGCITDGMARFNPGDNTLKLPNGRIYTFGHQVTSSQFGTVRYVTQIEDPFGNRIEFDYFSSPGPVDGVEQIRQYVGEASPRVITFTYNATLKSLATMTYAGRWT